MSGGPYSRVYWRFIDEYPEVYADPRALGTWVQLLVTAEMAYPTAPLLPRKLGQSVLNRLVDCGLVTLLQGDRYRIRGLDAERQRRSEAARKGGLASGRSRGVEPSLNGRSTAVEPTVNLDEQSKAKTSKEKTSKEKTSNGLLEPDYDERLAIARRRQGLPA